MGSKKKKSNLEMVCNENSTHFSLSKEDADSIEKWQTKHTKKCTRSISFAVTNSSGIGTSVEVHCICGSVLDITHYENW